MDRKWVLMLVFLVLFSACAKTRVIRYDQGQLVPEVNAPTYIIQAGTENTTIQSTPETQLVQNTRQNEPRTSQKESDVSEEIQEQESNVTTFDPDDEYTIISCCDEGRLFAETKKERTAYSEDQIKRILLTIYKDNCNKFNNIRNAIYLNYLTENQINGYLIAYTNNSVKRIVIDNKLITEDFNSCN